MFAQATRQNLHLNSNMDRIQSGTACVAAVGGLNLNSNMDRIQWDIDYKNNYSIPI